MNLNNLYNFKNAVRHFVDIVSLEYPDDVENFNTRELCWTMPISFNVQKGNGKYRTLKIPNVLNFVRAFHYYSGLPYFDNVQGINPAHSRMTVNFDTGDFVAGEYDAQLNDDFMNLCLYDNLIKLDIKDFYFGNPETTTGGRALKFYSSVRMDVRRIETLKQSGEMVGNRTRVKIVKNKIAPPFKEAEFDIMFGKGISKEGDILDLAVKCDLVSKSGAWFAYNGDKIGQGRENAKTYLSEHPEIMEELEQNIRAHYHIGAEGDMEETEEAAAEGIKKEEE